MLWNGENLAATGASFRPLGAVIGVEIYDAMLTDPMAERERRLLSRALRHRHLVCLRQRYQASTSLKAFAESLSDGSIGGVLAAPANLEQFPINLDQIDRKLLATNKVERRAAPFQAHGALGNQKSIAFIDQHLLNRARTIRPEFIYGHARHAGDVLIWTHRLKLAT